MDTGQEELTEPKCKEITVSASIGGKIQLVRYENTADYGYSMSRKYDIPRSWSEQDVKDFQTEQELRLRAEIEPIAQAEVNELEKQREELNS